MSPTDNLLGCARRAVAAIVGVMVFCFVGMSCVFAITAFAGADETDSHIVMQIYITVVVSATIALITAWFVGNTLADSVNPKRPQREKSNP